jgi:hypothetical protein
VTIHKTLAKKHFLQEKKRTKKENKIEKNIRKIKYRKEGKKERKRKKFRIENKQTFFSCDRQISENSFRWNLIPFMLFLPEKKYLANFHNFC